MLLALFVGFHRTAKGSGSFAAESCDDREALCARRPGDGGTGRRLFGGEIVVRLWTREQPVIPPLRLRQVRFVRPKAWAGGRKPYFARATANDLLWRSNIIRRTVA